MGSGYFLCGHFRGTNSLARMRHFKITTSNPPQACSARTGKHLFIGDRGYYCGGSRKIPKDKVLEVIESKTPVAVCFRDARGKTYRFSGFNFRRLR